MKKRFFKFILFIIPIGLVIFFWEIYSSLSFVNSSFFPPPTVVFKSAIKLFTEKFIYADIFVSLYRLVLGLLLGITVGIVFGLSTGTSKIFSSLFSPIIQIFKHFPPVAIIPLMIVWFGIDDVSKILSIAFAVFFPVWMGTTTGVRSIPEIYLQSAGQFTKSKLNIFFKIILPASVPYIISGIRTSISLSFIMVFVSELVGSSSGIGYRLSISQMSYRIDDMMVILILFGVMGALSDYLFVKATNLYFPWIMRLNK